MKTVLVIQNRIGIDNLKHNKQRDKKLQLKNPIEGF